MSKAAYKHDWIKYKQEFFKSKELSVAKFLKENYNIPSSGYAKYYKDWQKEKESYLIPRKLEVNQEIIEENKKEIDETFQNLLDLKQKIIMIINNRLATQKHNLHMNELEKALNIVKRELGEPLCYTENGTNAIQAFQNIQINFYDV